MSDLPFRPADHKPRKSKQLGRGESSQSQQIERNADDITFGCWESAFISLLSDAEIEIGHGLQSCTSKVGVYNFEHRGVRIFLVDTPGFDDTNRSDSEVLKDVAFWLAAAYTKETQLAGIISFIALQMSECKARRYATYACSKKLCGDNNLQSVILATTHWKSSEGVSIPEAEGQAKIKELVDTSEFWGAMVQRGSKVKRHDGSRQSALRIVTELVDREIRVTLDIQRQLIDKELDLDDTDAGQALQSELIAERKKCEERLTDLKEDLEMAMAENDVKRQKQIEADNAKHQAEVAKTYAETEPLRTNIEKIAEEKEQQFRALEPKMEQNRARHEEQLALSNKEEQRRLTELYNRQRRADVAKPALGGLFTVARIGLAVILGIQM